MWSLLGLVCCALVCVASSVASVKLWPKLSRRIISTPLKNGQVVAVNTWSIAAPSSTWRQLKPAAAAKMPVYKDLWFVSGVTDATIAVEEIKLEAEHQVLPQRFAEAMLEHFRTSSTTFEPRASSDFETCGVPAQLREFRAVGSEGDFTYVVGFVSAYGRAYDVSAWVSSAHFEEVADELREAVKSFCAKDPDFEREWLRNFIEVSALEKLDEALSAGDVTSRLQLSLELHSLGVARLARKDLERHTELQLRLTRTATPKECVDVFDWNLDVIEARLKTLPAAEIWEWYRLERRAQVAELEETAPANAADYAARNRAIERVMKDERWKAVFHVADEETRCKSTRQLYEYALSLGLDDKDALLRALVSYED